MTVLEWDAVGEKTYQAGIDHGVLYLPDLVVPWNGLTGVDHDTAGEIQPYYQDGIKYLDHEVIGDWKGKLKAFTYPDEFERCIGVKGSGVRAHGQRSSRFGLSYRTKIGNDAQGLDYGYTIHVLYNLRAIPDSQSYASLGDSVEAMEFGWTLSATPEFAEGIVPTAYISIKSTDVDSETLELIEGWLYGTEEAAPALPAFADLAAFVPTEVIV